jgi:glycosyltransferase involved in cell wall biosynthesis
MPKVSVIIPVYGVEKYIERCAESLFSQTLEDIEFIFIDDCSPDRSMELLKSIIEKYQSRIQKMSWRVRLESMPSNSGIAAVRRYGIEIATGDYIIHCDSDDWVDENAYEILYNKAIEEQADVVVGRGYVSDGRNHSFNPNVFFSEDKFVHIKLMLLGKASNSLCMKLIRHSIFKENPILFPIGNSYEDGTLSLQAIYYARKYILLNKPLYYYYKKNPNSITTRMTDFETVSNRLFESEKNISICEEFLKRCSIDKQYRNVLACMRFKNRMKLTKYLSDDRARKLFKTMYSGINLYALISLYIPLNMKLQYLFYCIKVL